jgi:hypothetical protein
MAQHWIAGLKAMAKAKALATRLGFSAAGLLAGLVVWLVCLPSPALAGPVNWQEVPSTAEGRQWWDSGSLRATKTGNLSVLSRFQPPNPGAPDSGTTGETESRPKRMADLYVMDIDCDQQLFRDTSINGIPQFKAEWLPAAGDNLISAVIEGSCTAARERGVVS